MACAIQESLAGFCKTSKLAHKQRDKQPCNEPTMPGGLVAPSNNLAP